MVGLLIVLPTLSFGHNKDSLRIIWSDHTNPTDERIKALNKFLSSSYGWLENDTLFNLAETLNEWANEIDDSLSLARSYQFFGMYYFNKGEFKSTIDNYHKALELFKKVKGKRHIPHSYNNLAQVYLLEGKYAEAIEYVFKSLKISEELNQTSLIIQNYLSLSSTYQKLQEFENSKFYLNKALDLSISSKDSILTLVVYGGIAGNHILLEEFEQAEAVLHRAIQFNELVKSKIDEAYLFLNMGENYQAWSEKTLNSSVEEAHTLMIHGLDYFKKSQEVFEAIGFKPGLLKAVLGKGNMYYLLGRLAKKENQTNEAQSMFIKATKLFESTFDKVKRSNELADMENTSKALFSLYKELGDDSKALKYHELYISLKDSIFNKEEQSKIFKQEYDYAYQKKALKDSLEFVKEREVAQLKIDNQEVTLNLQRYLLSGGSIILILLAVLSLVFFLSRKRIQKDKAKLEILNREKDGLINIVAHEIQTPLVSTFNFIEMEKLKEEDASKNKFLDKCQGQVNRVISLIRDILDVHRFKEVGQALKTEKVELAKALEDLLEKSERDAAQKSIQFQATGIKNVFIKTDPQLLSRILENLISNAIKFSPANKSVKLESKKKNNQFFLSVIDEGPGFTEADKAKMFEKFQTLSARPTSGENSFGLGLSIVKTLVEQIGAKLSLESEQGKGAKFTLQFDLA